LLAQSLCECIVLPGSSGKSDENDRASGPSKKIDLGAFRVLFGLGTKSIIWVQEHEIGAIQSGAFASSMHSAGDGDGTGSR
jgi:hypothetical protein